MHSLPGLSLRRSEDQWARELASVTRAKPNGFSAALIFAGKPHPGESSAAAPDRSIQGKAHLPASLRTREAGDAIHQRALGVRVDCFVGFAPGKKVGVLWRHCEVTK